MTNNKLEFIKRCKNLGLSPKEILNLLEGEMNTEETTNDIAEDTEVYGTETVTVIPKENTNTNLKRVFIYKKMKDGSYQIQRVNYNYVADYLLKNNSILYALPNEADKKGIYYIYIDGVYKKTNDGFIDSIIKDYLRKLGDTFVTPENVSRIKNLMIPELVKSYSVEPSDFDKNENIINFKNGLLKLDTLELIPHDKKYLTSVQIPCNWVGTEAETPVFDKYMSDFTKYRTDKDKKLVRQCLLEFLGLIISNIPGYRYKQGCALLVHGSGHAGKSQLRDFAVEMIGRKNTAITYLSELENREGPSKAYGKRLLGAGDMKFGTASQISTFKNITGGDAVTIRYLYVEGFTAKLDGVFWFCSNEFPKFGGDQGAHVYDRILPIRADYVIPEKDRDPLLLQKMLKEREGIIYKAILALKATIAAGYRHTFPDCAYEDINKYKEENSSVVEFFRTCCITEIEADGADGIRKIPIETSEHSQAEIRKIFTNWAKVNYSNIPNKHQFEKAIADELGVEESDLTYRTNSKRGYRYFDVAEDVAQDYWS